MKAHIIHELKSQLFFIIALLALVAAPALAADMTVTNAVSTDLVATNEGEFDYMQKLWETKVTILGTSEKISETPAAVTVITQDDIRRSGAASLPEVLRMVPGMDVAQIDAHQWAVSSRGFNNIFSDKLLVLQDGRSIYTQLFGGVFWDVQGTMMEDIDRVEVVRGPGATYWGENAMNGVINIVTRSADETQGWLVSGGGGTFDRGFVNARYGGKLSDNLYYRVYGTYMNHEDTPLPGGADSHTDWQLGRGGFRMDWKPPGENLVTLQGDGYGGEFHEVFTENTFPVPPFFAATRDDMHARGADVLGRWTHDFSDNSNFKLQAYYDRTERFADVLSETRDTFDISWQHQFPIVERHNITWGLGYRLNSDHEGNTPTVAFAHDSRAFNIFSGFAQDEIMLVKDLLNLTVGSKIEDNGYTGFEFEPSARLLWTPTANNTFWASVSRSVRTPARANDDLIFSQPPGVTIYGNGDLRSESLIAYELGYRTKPFDNLTLDLATFYNDYHHLQSTELGTSPTQPATTPYFPLHYGDLLRGSTYGGEISATWRATAWWQLQPSYSLFQIHLYNYSGSTDASSVSTTENQAPQNQFMLRSLMDLPHNITLDTALRYVDSMAMAPAQGIPSVHAYVTLDARLAWKPRKNIELSIVGQSLLQKRHTEFSSTAILANPQTQVPRSVYGKITMAF